MKIKQPKRNIRYNIFGYYFEFQMNYWSYRDYIN